MKQFLKCLIILLLTLHCGNIYAQKQGQARIDSLLKEFPKQKEDTNKVKLLNDLSFGYYSINPDEGIKYGQQGLELATKLEWEKGIANANSTLGNNYLFKSDYPKALEYYQKVKKMEEEIGDKTGIVAVTCNIGNVYKHQCDYPNALEYYFKALKIYEEIGNKIGIVRVTGNIGSVYASQSDYPKALEYFFKGLKMSEEFGDRKNSIARFTISIGTVYQNLNDYPKALEYYFKTLKMNEEIGDKNGIAEVTCDIGSVYQNQSDHPKALEYFFKALKMDEKIGNKKGMAINIGNIGEVYTAQKNYTMAIEFAQRALKMDEEIGYKRGAAFQLSNMGIAYVSLVTDTFHINGVTAATEIPEGIYKPNGDIPKDKTARLRKAIDYLQKGLAIGKEINAPDVMQPCYEHLAEAYKLKGDYKKAMEYADNYRAIKDSVFSKENSNKIAKMENDRKQYGDSLKTAAAKKVADIKAQHQRNYEYIGAGIIVLLIGFTFLVTWNNKLLSKERKRSDNLLLNILPEEVASQLKDTGAAAAKQFDDVTVLFTDFVNFTSAGERMSPQALIDELNTCFKAFDEITDRHNVEKIKTIGDAYLAVAGLPTADPKHAENIVRAAIDINAFMQDRLAKLGNGTFDIRIGIHSGSVVAGIVGLKKFAYDIWGDTVNTAARMEQNSEAGKINISQTTYELVKDKFTCEYRGEIDAKGKGMLKMYYIV